MSMAAVEKNDAPLEFRRLSWAVNGRKNSTSSVTSSTALAVCLDFGVDNAHVPSQRIIAREGLLLATKWATDLLLAVVVNGVFVSCEVVGS